MDIQLQSPSPAITILDTSITQEEATLMLHCHDRTFKRATITDSSTLPPKPIFLIEGATAGTSWSWRRKVFSTDNNDDEEKRPLFDFRHENFDLKNRWVIEEAGTGRKIGSIVHRDQLTTAHSAVDATVRTRAGEDVIVRMRPRDGGALVVAVEVGDAVIATIRKVADNTTVKSSFAREEQDKTVWELRVAAAVDLSLIAMLALCRAEMAHVWKQ